MEHILKQFINGNLLESCKVFLGHLHIVHTQEEPTPICFQDYYESHLPQYIEKALKQTTHCYYIGEVCDDAIKGVANADAKLKEDLEKELKAFYGIIILFYFQH